MSKVWRKRARPSITTGADPSTQLSLALASIKGWVTRTREGTRGDGAIRMALPSPLRPRRAPAPAGHSARGLLLGMGLLSARSALVPRSALSEHLVRR